MPTLLCIWGIIATFQGFVTSFKGLLAVRFFLGLVEGPMTPAILLYLSGFYPRRNLSVRIAFFLASSTLSAAFSGLLAAAIQDMNGLGGKAGWRWIIILEGLFSVVMGFAGFFLIPSTPRRSKFINEREKDLIERRLEKDRPSIGQMDKLDRKQIINSIMSPHVILLSVVMFLQGTIVYGLGFFVPSIVDQLGFSATRSQLLSAGPFGAGFLVAVTASYLSDRYKARGIPIAILSAVSTVGFVVYLCTKRKYVAYGSIYLTVPGTYASTPILASWIANNSEPHYRRATSIAVGIVALGCGGILSTWRFPTKEGPRFTTTTIMNIVFCVVIGFAALLNSFFLSRMNASKQRRRSEILAPYTDDSDEKNRDAGMTAWVELGDNHPDFHYNI
ncbi:hypothetical protein BS47DRAFT_1337603 [Hydnum rufescens UP504]|uniref:Major facilitator superfamily (MFS) profile domain-containing protein n=1 Tax=Hydnum rufescens UP504 TaxID=1448309 RepID=A0A9P6B7A3_9AGAM|nr:hypothetical protein BS47DRAFT_1337603 [Hydnum rufescens UP504]